MELYDHDEEDCELFDFKSDQSVIIRKKYLPSVSRIDYHPETPSSKPPPLEWYPFVNSYYPYTEDVDAFARVNHLLESNPSFDSLTTLIEGANADRTDAYSENAAQVQYLQSKPTCFLILGKPGIGQQKVGKLLADYWKCVYIDPETLIEDEIAAGTRAGSCIEFNLRSGRAIGVDIILRLLEKRVRSKTVQHRGFVLCGFPLIQNDLYEEDPVSSESAVFNVREIFEEMFQAFPISTVAPHVVLNVSETSTLKQGEMEGEGAETTDKKQEMQQEDEKKALPEEEEPPSPSPSPGHAPLASPQAQTLLDVGSAYSDVCAAGDIGVNYEEQLNFIFSQFGSEFVLIYIMCPNVDVVSKHADYRFDVATSTNLDLQEHELKKQIYTIFSKEIGTVNELPEEFFEKFEATQEYEPSNMDLRNFVRLPRDFPANVTSQLERYHSAVLTVIERHVLQHDPQYFIKVDGRCTSLRMFNIIKNKLRILPLQKVIIPEKLNVQKEIEPGAEDDDQQHVRFNIDEITPEEGFEAFRKKNIAGPSFKWTWSNWGVKCPVSMAEGEYKDGTAAFAVSFMNKMFFLSNEEAYIKFYRNPRPYLLPPFPKVNCRILVMGPKYSGKTAVAKCLAYLLNAEIISPEDEKRRFLENKKAECNEHLTNKAMNEAINLLRNMKHEEWMQSEEERQLMVEEWSRICKELLSAYQLKYPVVTTDSDSNLIDLDMISSFPIQLATAEFPSQAEEVEQEEEITELAKKTFSEICLLLKKQNVTCDNLEHCQVLLDDQNQLLEYLPENLNYKEMDEVDIVLYDEFIKDYIQKALAEVDYADFEFSNEHLHEMFTSKMKEIEDKNKDNANVHVGWVVDGMPMNLELLKMLTPEQMPEEIFILYDESDNQFLISKFKEKDYQEFQDFRDFFLAIEKMDAAWRAPPLNPPPSEVDIEEIDAVSIQSEKIVRKEVSKYKIELENFGEQRNDVVDFFNSKPVIVSQFQVTNKSIPELLKEVVDNVDDRYRQQPSVFTPEDRLQELAELGEPVAQEDELGAEEMENEKGDIDIPLQNRRYGNTSYYCPVVFHNHWVLWKGKEEYGVQLENKLYFCCSESAMNEFLTQPRKYLTENKPPLSFPPPRICVVGAKGSGKTTVAKALAENYGLYYLNFTDLLNSEAASDESALEEYIKSDSPLPNELLSKILNRYWFEQPVKNIGFVIDNFPFRPSDVDVIDQHFFIPDVILELSIPERNLRERNLNALIADWAKKMERDQEKRDSANRKVMDEWEENRAVRYKELMEQKREERYKEKLKEKTAISEDITPRPYMEDLKETDEDTERYTSVKSQVTFDSVAEQVDAKEVNQILAEEMPEPVFEDDFETIEQARERFEDELEEMLLSETDYIKVIGEYCDAENIPWRKINADLTVDQVIAQAYRLCGVFKFRNKSCFETCFDVSVEVSEKLLDSGYYFLSKFGRTCPVQAFEKKISIQMFLPLEQKYKVFPLIHRQYIYFLAGKSNRDKFEKDPLKYIFQSFNFPLLPMKIGVIGPPKCGKTALSERFFHEFGLKVISRGGAARYVLEYIPHSQLAKDMEEELRNGFTLTSEMVARCVEAAAFDPKCATQGMVFDGFPSSIEEVRQLANIGLIPHLVVDLEASYDQIMECLASDVGKRRMPRFSKKFINFRYEVWRENYSEFKEWFDREYQILTGIPITSSMWGVWNSAYEIALSVCYEVKHYYKHAKHDWPLRLANMQVTPLEFIERQSCYKTYCPCCLHYFNKLSSGGDPPDRTGLVHFRKHFYWLCEKHIEEFLKYPESFLPPYNNNTMPTSLPTKISALDGDPSGCYANGVCVVCYVRNLPEQVLVEGRLKYAASYNDRTYLFDSPSCLSAFMSDPAKYWNVSITSLDKDQYPILKYPDLPTLGLLEQHVARQVVKAVTQAGIQRPIVPGLDARVSAAICIGLHLKLNNPATPKSYIPLYQEAYNRYEERTECAKASLKDMKQMINPYLYYEEPLPEFSMPEPEKLVRVESSVSTASSMMNILDEILDNISYTSE